MKSRYHSQYVSYGFKYTPGSSCGCKAFYLKDYGTAGSVVVQVERCKGNGANKRPHKRCPWEWVHVIRGEVQKRMLEGDMADFEQFLEQQINQEHAV